MSYELIGRVRNEDAGASLYEAQEALDERDFRGACTMAAVAVHYVMRGARITGPPEWDRPSPGLETDGCVRCPQNVGHDAPPLFGTDSNDGGESGKPWPVP